MEQNPGRFRSSAQISFLVQYLLSCSASSLVGRWTLVPEQIWKIIYIGHMFQGCSFPEGCFPLLLFTLPSSQKPVPITNNFPGKVFKIGMEWREWDMKYIIIGLITFSVKSFNLL
jgi:hypothetical protein